jgi:hypothetical protein
MKSVWTSSCFGGAADPAAPAAALFRPPFRASVQQHLAQTHRRVRADQRADAARKDRHRERDLILAFGVDSVRAAEDVDLAGLQRAEAIAGHDRHPGRGDARQSRLRLDRVDHPVTQIDGISRGQTGLIAVGKRPRVRAIAELKRRAGAQLVEHASGRARFRRNLTDCELRHAEQHHAERQTMGCEQ